MTRPSGPARTLAAKMPQHAKAIATMDPWLVVNELFEMKGEDQLDPSRPTFITEPSRDLTPHPAQPPRTQGSPTGPISSSRAWKSPCTTPNSTIPTCGEVPRAAERARRGKEHEENVPHHGPDFLRALRVGMLPAEAWPCIDRLCDDPDQSQRTIRDVMLFPLMRPEA